MDAVVIRAHRIALYGIVVTLVDQNPIDILIDGIAGDEIVARTAFKRDPTAPIGINGWVVMNVIAGGELVKIKTIAHVMMHGIAVNF